MIHVDIYPVGLFLDIKDRRRSGWSYLSRQAKARNWRAVHNYFNGYLAEAPVGSRAGHAWTRRRAYSDLMRVLIAEGYA